MPLVSMTGFGEARGAYGPLHWRWEVKSVNGRGLDIRLRLPPGYDSLEAGGRQMAGARFKRGSLQAVLTAATDETVRGFTVDARVLADAVRIAKSVAEDSGLEPGTIATLLALKGVVVQEDSAELDDAARMARDAALLESLADAFDLLVEARRAEGAKLEGVLLVRIAEIERLAAEAKEHAATQPAQLRDRLTAQLTELTEVAKLPEERVAQEVALLAARANTAEEIDRIAAHCQEARALIAGKEPAGRKLDFLAQEFNRESNTLCSKSTDIALTRVGLALKATVDELREQIQNVE